MNEKINREELLNEAEIKDEDVKKENSKITTSEKTKNAKSKKSGNKEKQSEIIYGVVFNCERLRVRSAGEFGPNIITEIPANTKVQIFPRESSKNFWKIRTQNDVVGFVMKDYVEVL